METKTREAETSRVFLVSVDPGLLLPDRQKLSRFENPAQAWNEALPERGKIHSEMISALRCIH